MLIDLNGMWFHLKIFPSPEREGFNVEIVDEAFSFGVLRGEAEGLDSIATFVETYSGIRPRTDVLTQIAHRLEELFQESSQGSTVAASVVHPGIRRVGNL